MITDDCQRWEDGVGSYRRAGESFNRRAYEVETIADDTTARQFVTTHHYSGTYPSARFRFGLRTTGGELVGVAVFSHPVREASLHPLPLVRRAEVEGPWMRPGRFGSDSTSRTIEVEGERLDRVELGRLVLFDRCPGNTESFFVARCFELLGRDFGITGVLSMSDPMKRRDRTGALVFGGHVGVIYQALGARYIGQAGRHTIRLLPDGSVMNARAISKIRAREVGVEYAAALLERAGAAPLRPNDDSRAWLKRWLPAVTRTARHPGNHRYLFGIDPMVRAKLPTGIAYPRIEAAA